MSLKRVATVLSLGRAALGVGLLLAPEKITEGWLGKAGTTDQANVLARGVGARDLVIGTGTFLALSRDQDSARAWLLASGVADLADTAATVSAKGKIPDAGVYGTAALAGISAVVCLTAAATD